MNTNGLLETITLFQAQKAEKTEGIKALIRELRQECKHPVILEADYVPSTDFSNAQPEYRMCEICRIEEEGWNCGFQILTNSLNRIIKNVKREQLWNHRIRECCCRVGNSLLRDEFIGKLGSFKDIKSGKVVQEF